MNLLEFDPVNAIRLLGRIPALTLGADRRDPDLLVGIANTKRTNWAKPDHASFACRSQVLAEVAGDGAGVRFPKEET